MSERLATLKSISTANSTGFTPILVTVLHGCIRSQLDRGVVVDLVNEGLVELGHREFPEPWPPLHLTAAGAEALNACTA